MNAIEVMDVTYERFCFPVTLRCNLKCRLCAEHSPYYEKPYHPSYGELTKQLDALFQLVRHIGKLDITGGEPFLRTDLPEIIEYIYQNYRDKIGILRITTNGTLLPPEGLLEAAGLWGGYIDIIVDNYEISHKSMAAYELLMAAGIPCEHRDYLGNLHCGGWVDYGDLTLKHTREEAKHLFKKCMVPKLGYFSCMVNGIVFPCARARLLYEQFIVDVSVDLFDAALTEAGKKERLNRLLRDEVMEACRFCNGLCEKSPRYTPAEQLSHIEVIEQPQYDDWRLNYGKLLFYTQTYNNEKTIARTIESVLRQTNQDYTYFICNNGSTDNTGNIIKELAQDDAHIVFVECERNDILAVNLVPRYLFAYIPKYLDNYFCIVDGDDSLQENFCQKAMDIITEQEVDMIVPAYNRISAEDGSIIKKCCLKEDLNISGNEKADNFMSCRPLLLCQWGKIYRWNKYKKLQNILVYKYYLTVPKWFHQMDTVAVLSIFYQSETVVFISSPVYNYYISSQSTYGFYRPKRIQNDVLMFRIYNDFLGKYGTVKKIHSDYCYAIYLSLLYENLNSITNAKTINTQQKLSDIYDILKTKETKDMLTGKFDPMFKNLADKKSFLKCIQGYLKTLEPYDKDSINTKNIIEELNKYGDYSVD